MNTITFSSTAFLSSHVVKAGAFPVLQLDLVLHVQYFVPRLDIWVSCDWRQRYSNQSSLRQAPTLAQEQLGRLKWNLKQLR